jgi:hypothetical protein
MVLHDTHTVFRSGRARIFYLETIVLLNQMKSTLQDYVETGVSMRYNKYN